jgi:alpha-L-fucosidase 2
MLMQSHGETIRLLPACPTSWPSGWLRGLRARGGFTVDLEWSEGRPRRATIVSSLGRDCRLTAPTAALPPVVRCDGNAVETEPGADRTIRFETRPGGVYELVWE